MRKIFFRSILPLAAVVVIGCSSTPQFAGGNKRAATADDSQASTSSVESPSSTDDVGPTEDVGTASANPGKTTCDKSADSAPPAFPENIQKCIDESHIFNFYTNECSPVDIAKSFPCTYEGIKEILTTLGIKTESIDVAVAAKAQLVGCGEKREGKTVITQWWNPTEQQLAEDDCSLTSTTAVTTGCFQLATSDGTVTEGQTDAEKSAIIKKCLE
jgi:hypothetical protein